MYVLRSALRTAGNALGPLVAVVVFLIYGDTWKADELVSLMIAGVLVMLAPVCCLLLFRDARALGAASESLLVVNHQNYHTYSEKSVNGGPLHAADMNGGPLCADAIAPLTAAGEQGNGSAGAGAGAGAPPDACAQHQAPVRVAGAAPLLDEERARYAREVAAMRLRQRRFLCLHAGHIAPLVALGDLFQMFGSGMTANFVSLFFWRELHMHPIEVSSSQAPPRGVRGGGCGRPSCRRVIEGVSRLASLIKSVQLV